MADNNLHTIEYIMTLPPEQRRKEYTAIDIDKVIIDGNVFNNYGAYSFIWEKSYVKSPNRSQSGALGNLDSYSTFITGHLKIDFTLMSIDYYRKLMQLIYAKNEFIVECYDIVYDKTIKLKMYFTTEEMPKLWTIANKIQSSTPNEWEEWVELVGIKECSVEMVGTNNDLSYISVTYHKNPPTTTGIPDSTIGSNEIYMGEEIIIGKGSNYQEETFNNTYKFAKWNTEADGTGLNYIDNQVYTINTSLILYAIWDKLEN